MSDTTTIYDAGTIWEHGELSSRTGYPVVKLADYLAAVDKLEAERKEAVSGYHEWIRTALHLPPDAPLRFDFYAQEIGKLEAEVKAAVSAGFQSQWEEATRQQMESLGIVYEVHSQGFKHTIVRNKRAEDAEAENKVLKQERDKDCTIAHDCGFNATTLLAAAQVKALRDQVEKDRIDFLDLNEYWNGGNGSATDACQHTCEVTESALNRIAARAAAPPADKAYELQDGMLRKAYEDSGDAGRFTWSGWLLNLVRDNAVLEAEVKALREKLARLSVPVSDEEFIKHCSLIWIQGEDTQGLLFERDDVDALLAARTADTKEEPKP